MRRAVPSLAGVAAFVALACPAFADDAPAAEQPVRMQYEAPEGCPDSLAFFLRVRARTQRVRLAEAGELATLVSVNLSSGDQGSSGTLEMPDADGKPSVRRVDASTCDEVALALSLVLALAFDPDAITTFDAAPVPAPPPPQVVPSAPPPAPPPPPPPVAPPPPFALSVGALVLGRSGVTPVFTPLFGAFVDYGSSSDEGFAPRGSAAVFFSGEHDTAVTSEATRRTTTLEFFGAELAGCPVSLRILPPLALRPCLAFDFGKVFGVAGPEVEPGHAGSLTWVSVSALARFRWKIAGALFVEPSAGGGLTIFHDKFSLLGPPQTVHELPSAFYEVGIAAGVHFP